MATFSTDDSESGPTTPPPVAEFTCRDTRIIRADHPAARSFETLDALEEYLAGQKTWHPKWRWPTTLLVEPESFDRLQREVAKQCGYIITEPGEPLELRSSQTGTIAIQYRAFNLDGVEVVPDPGGFSVGSLGDLSRIIQGLRAHPDAEAFENRLAVTPESFDLLVEERVHRATEGRGDFVDPPTSEFRELRRKLDYALATADALRGERDKAIRVVEVADEQSSRLVSQLADERSRVDTLLRMLERLAPPPVESRIEVKGELTPEAREKLSADIARAAGRFGAKPVEVDLDEARAKLAPDGAEIVRGRCSELNDDGLCTMFQKRRWGDEGVVLGVLWCLGIFGFLLGVIILSGCAGAPRLTPRGEITRATYEQALETTCDPDYLGPPGEWGNPEAPDARTIAERAESYIRAMGWDIETLAQCGVSKTGRTAVWLSPCIDWGDPHELAHILVHEAVHVCQRAALGNVFVDTHTRVVPGYVNAPFRWAVELQARRAEIQARAVWGVPESKLRYYAAERARKFCSRGSVYWVWRLRDCRRTSQELLEYEITWGPYQPRRDDHRFPNLVELGDLGRLAAL